MTEYAAKECVFHFNKHHLVDPTTPMWILKFGGKTTLYLNHVICNVPWSTKETPDNPHTKGAIKIKNVLITVNEDNEAEVNPLKKGDLSRIKANKKGYARILVSTQKGELKEYLENNKIAHGPIQKISGSCGTSFDLIDIKKKEDLVLLALTFQGSYRVLEPHEVYYRAYDQPELLAQLDADEYYDGEDIDDDE